MKCKRMLLLVTTTVAMLIAAVMAWAADLLITGPISGIQNYDSPEGIIVDDAVLAPTAVVTATSTYEVYLKPGTSIQGGARLVITMRDNDGLPNRCEMIYFGNLDQNPDDDYDGDQLTNAQECQLDTDPTDNNPDTDGDGLPDWWEVQFFGLNLNAGRNDDPDGDGISNFVEHKLGTDPTVVNEKGPGLHYKYDKLGRIIKIDRIPGR